MLCQEAEFCDTAPMLATAFTELVGCQVPIQQAAMGGASTPQLAIAVSRAGGLGMLEHASLIPLADRVAAVEQAHAGPFGVNFLMPFLDRSKLDDVELAAGRARLVEFFYDTPDPGLISLVHAGGALAGWQVGSVAEAMQAVDAGCDLIIAQGVEAGGHVRGAVGLIPLLADVLEVVTVPVLAAGGISTARGMAAALAAGAAGVRVGTRFVATEESGAHLRCRCWRLPPKRRFWWRRSRLVGRARRTVCSLRRWPPPRRIRTRWSRCWKPRAGRSQSRCGSSQHPTER